MYFVLMIEKDKIMNYGCDERLYVVDRLAQNLANLKQCIILIQGDDKKVMFVKPKKGDKKE